MITPDTQKLFELISSAVLGTQRRRAIKILRRIERSLDTVREIAIIDASEAARLHGGSSAEDAVLALLGDDDEAML